MFLGPESKPEPVKMCGFRLGFNDPHLIAYAATHADNSHRLSNAPLKAVDYSLYRRIGRTVWYLLARGTGDITKFPVRS